MARRKAIQRGNVRKPSNYKSESGEVRLRVLVISGGFLPGFRYGGPVRTLAAMVEHLGDEIEFSIVTSGSDMGERAPYPGVVLDSWTRAGKADVWYTKGFSRLSACFWRRRMAERRPDVVYVNSFFHPVSSAFLLLRRFRLVPRVPVVIAPRGEFAKSALAIKEQKKRFFLCGSRLIRLHHGLTWQASSEAEAGDIRRAMGKIAQRIQVAPDLTIPSRSVCKTRIKVSGSARFVWIGRIARVKNLVGALRLLSGVHNGTAHIDLYGPIEDQDYWRQCLEATAGLPANVTFTYHGELSHDDVPGALSKSHFLLFPTLGENFGHSIAEALDQGLPVLVSDQTPWRNLREAGVGWDIPLDDMGEWASMIDRCVSMTNDEYQSMSASCLGYVAQWLSAHGGRAANWQMLMTAAAPGDQ